MIERINPHSLRTPDEYYVHVIKAGGSVYVAGQAAVGMDRKVLGVGDVVAQTEEVFRQLRECLRAAGTDFDHVVRLNTYIVNADDAPKVAVVRSRLLREAGLHPASTLVVVKSLAWPEMLIEIECVAVLPEGK